MRRINRCLNVKLLEICQHTVQIEELNAKLREYLPESMREQCHVGSFNKGSLVLIASDAGWASQLRYCLPELRDRLRSEAGIYNLISIKVTIKIEEPVKAIPRKTTHTISAKTCTSILANADECSYSPLKQALQDLVEHLGKD